MIDWEWLWYVVNSIIEGIFKNKYINLNEYNLIFINLKDWYF